MRTPRSILAALVVVFVVVFGAVHLLAQTTPPAPATASLARRPVPAFVGSDSCAACHKRSIRPGRARNMPMPWRMHAAQPYWATSTTRPSAKDGVVTTFLRRDERFSFDGGSGREARRIRDRLHPGRCAIAAIPRRDAGRTAAGFRHRLGYATRRRRRPALVRPLSRPETAGRRPDALDGHPAGRELHVCRLPRHQSAQEFRRKANSYSSSWSESVSVARPAMGREPGMSPGPVEARRATSRVAAWWRAFPDAATSSGAPIPPHDRACRCRSPARSPRSRPARAAMRGDRN